MYAAEYRDRSATVVEIIRTRSGFDVVDASPVIVIATAEHCAQPLFGAEPPTDCRVVLGKRTAVYNGRIAVYSGAAVERLVVRRSGDKVDRSADRISVLIGRER